MQCSAGKFPLAPGRYTREDPHSSAQPQHARVRVTSTASSEGTRAVPGPHVPTRERAPAGREAVDGGFLGTSEWGDLDRWRGAGPLYSWSRSSRGDTLSSHVGQPQPASASASLSSVGLGWVCVAPIISTIIAPKHRLAHPQTLTHHADATCVFLI